MDPTGTFCAVPDEWLKKKLGKLKNNNNRITVAVAEEEEHSIPMQLKTNLLFISILFAVEAAEPPTARQLYSSKYSKIINDNYFPLIFNLNPCSFLRECRAICSLWIS